MEAIFHTGKNNELDSLTEDDIDDLKNHYAEAVRLWQKISTTPFDTALYNFNDQKFSQMKVLIVKEAEALDGLKKAIDSNDSPKIVKAAMGIKPNYAELYKLFGNFERVQKK